MSVTLARSAAGAPKDICRWLVAVTFLRTNEGATLGRAPWPARTAQGAARRRTGTLRASPWKSDRRQDAAAGVSGSAVRLAAFNVGADRADRRAAGNRGSQRRRRRESPGDDPLAAHDLRSIDEFRARVRSRPAARSARRGPPRPRGARPRRPLIQTRQLLLFVLDPLDCLFQLRNSNGGKGVNAEEYEEQAQCRPILRSTDAQRRSKVKKSDDD